MSDFVLARRLQSLGRRSPVAGWNEVVDSLHAAAPLSRAAVMVLCAADPESETRRVDLIALLAGTPQVETEARLVRFLKDTSPRVVRAAVRGLAASGTHRCAAALAAVGGAETTVARRALARVQARMGQASGAVSEASPRTDGRLSVSRQRRDGRLSLEPE